MRLSLLAVVALLFGVLPLSARERHLIDASALAAARAWQETLPNSRDARRIELQILIALNRISETVEPLRAEVAATSQIERPLLMAVIVRNYSRASDKKLAASVVEQALVDELKSPTTGGLAWATVGRLRLNAGDASGALVTRVDPRTNKVIASIKTEGYPGNRQPSIAHFIEG